MKRDLYSKYDFDGFERTIGLNSKSLNNTPLKLQSTGLKLRNKRINNRSVVEEPPKFAVSK